MSLSSPGRSTDRFCQSSPVVVNNMSEPVTVSLSSPGRSTAQVGVLLGFARAP